MASLERFLHDEPVRMERIVKAALAHAQFETIHPFLDGNGRIGRLLITLLFCLDGVLHEPLLYLSLYLKQHRSEYYDLLDRVRAEGDWESWIVFFAEGVRSTADGAAATARSLAEMFQGDRGKIRALARSAGSALRVHEALQRRPVASVASLVAQTGLTTPTVTSAISGLTHLGVVREITGRRRNRLFRYEAYLSLLQEGTEPLPERPR
jgi:Fic family protein